MEATTASKYHVALTFEDGSSLPFVTLQFDDEAMAEKWAFEAVGTEQFGGLIIQTSVYRTEDGRIINLGEFEA